MKPVFLVPLVALALAGGGAGAYFWVTSGGGTEEAAVAQPTPTPEPAPTATATPTPALQTYRNEKYGYEVRFPAGYRVANFFTDAFAGVISDPSRTIEPEDYFVFTALSPQEEELAVQQASRDEAIGLAPWFNFDAGMSVDIFPLDVLYPDVTPDAFLSDVDMAGIVRRNSKIRDEVLTSGEAATRLTRREVDNNGDFTYDMVIVMGKKDEPTAFVIRIVKTPGYVAEAFETIFRSFAND